MPCVCAFTGNLWKLIGRAVGKSTCTPMMINDVWQPPTTHNATNKKAIFLQKKKKKKKKKKERKKRTKKEKKRNTGLSYRPHGHHQNYTVTPLFRDIFWRWKRDCLWSLAGTLPSLRTATLLQNCYKFSAIAWSPIIQFHNATVKDIKNGSLPV